MELCPVNAQGLKGHDLGKSVLDSSSSLFMNVLSLVTDLQRPLERCRAIIAQEDVDRLCPSAVPFLALHHHCPAKVGVIPFPVGHALPPFFASVLRNRYDSSPV